MKKNKKDTRKQNNSFEFNEDQLSPLAKMVVDAYDAKHDVPERRLDNDHDEDQQPITPARILYSQLVQMYGIDGDPKRFEEFMSRLNVALSLLATQGADTFAFGRDFNDLFSVVVTTLNVCSCMKKRLDENGIKFNVHKAIQGLMSGDDLK